MKVHIAANGIYWNDEFYKVPRPQSCWLCQFARELLRRGVDQTTGISAYRKGVPLFLETTVGWWASKTVVENDKDSVRISKYVPFGGISEEK